MGGWWRLRSRGWIGHFEIRKRAFSEIELGEFERGFEFEQVQFQEVEQEKKEEEEEEGELNPGVLRGFPLR